MIRVTNSLFLTAVSAFSIALLFAGTTYTIAETIYDHSGLATCVPDANDPCADIVAPGTALKISPSAVTGRARIQESSAGIRGGVAGATAGQLTGPDLQIGKTQNNEKAIKYVNTTIIERNNTPFSIYWRVAAVRGGKAWAWPSGNTYYTARKYSSVTKVISCIRGETLYFGATSTNLKYYWGYSADFNQTCNSGCTSYCSGGTITVTLSY